MGTHLLTTTPCTHCSCHSSHSPVWSRCSVWCVHKCGMIPVCNLVGGKDPTETCKEGAKFCEVKFKNDSPDEKGCSAITEIPKGYKHVDGDPDKQCKVTHNKDDSTTTHCYCARDTCNHDVQAYKPQAGTGQGGGRDAGPQGAGDRDAGPQGAGGREAQPQGAGVRVLGGGVGLLIVAVAQYLIW